MKKKRIIINNKKDLDKFYDHIKYYRSFFYRHIYFESDNKDISDIIDALNIKKRRDRITYIYDVSCNYLDNYYKGKKLCSFNKDGYCLTNTLNGCCRRCINRTSKGCSTKNLTCKLFYCSKVCEKYKVLKYDDIELLKCLPYRCKIIINHNYFTNRIDYLNDLYIGSIIIFLIRYLYRSVIHKIKKTK